MTERKKPRSVLWILLVIGLPIACLMGTAIAAAVGLPMFLGYVKRAKTSEVEPNLKAMFAGAASYYETTDHCIVGPSTTSNVPSSTPTLAGPLGGPFQELGFSLPDYTYFQYEIVSNGPSCGHGPNEALYTLVAYGDLDGDGVRSRFELAIGSDSNNEIYRTPGIYIENELE